MDIFRLYFRSICGGIAIKLTMSKKLYKGTFLVFIVQAYGQEAPDGTLIDLCTLELIDTSAERAIERSKKIVTKKFYRLGRVIEREIL